jgi:hypothetical protein
MSRLDALLARKYTTRDGEEKTQFTKIGAAFPTRTGGGYSVVLDAMPAPDRETGQYRIVLMPPMERDDNRDNRAPRPDKDDPRTGGGMPGRYSDDLGDEIPFAPCM